MKSTSWDTRATDSIIKSGQKDTEASIRILKTRLDLECSSSALNKHAVCKGSTLQGQNRHIISCTWSAPLVFLQRSCLLNARLKHFRSDLVFKRPRLRNDFIFGMLYLCIYLRIKASKTQILTSSVSKIHLPYSY